jgi:hypothetical protein
MEGEYSNGEDAEVEDLGDDIEVDMTARNEETRKTSESLLSRSLLSSFRHCWLS